MLTEVTCLKTLYVVYWALMEIILKNSMSSRKQALWQLKQNKEHCTTIDRKCE